jgi:hypothetical protein
MRTMMREDEGAVVVYEVIDRPAEYEVGMTLEWTEWQGELCVVTNRGTLRAIDNGIIKYLNRIDRRRQRRSTNRD